MEQKYWFLIIGVVIGWITKFPLVLKWYRELKKTRDYQKMKIDIHFEEMMGKYNEMFPENKITSRYKRS